MSELILKETDSTLVSILQNVGIKPNIAKTLACLNGRTVTAREIERMADLRQPEVSVALKYLEGNDWVEHGEQKTATRGRPTKVYNLSVPMSHIIDMIETEKREEVSTHLQLLSIARSVIG